MVYLELFGSTLLDFLQGHCRDAFVLQLPLELLAFYEAFLTIFLTACKLYDILHHMLHVLDTTLDFIIGFDDVNRSPL